MKGMLKITFLILVLLCTISLNSSLIWLVFPSESLNFLCNHPLIFDCLLNFGQAHSIDHLVIPTRDYCFAPSLADLCQAVDFIYGKHSMQLAAFLSPVA